ncbi:protein kinase domain-containing protein [Streptomyces griseosporeus]|uniref:non-specific serine/threonine protein kinase n=2 Tax=Streptomyces griseosporeus TaxID=1910 RepID=A0ABV3KMU7_STRGS|nr:serine/threonine-protein kinase [Streptomyces actuosus]
MAGRYRLVESIGQGGMGRVWRAVDEILDRLVAVKEIRIDGPDAEDARTRRERTLREARATARIDHPHVVRVYDVVDEGELLWIVMELVAGRSLERLTAERGALGPREAARIGLGLLAALRQVHARGVLHRDIKPGNVLVDADGDRVVLTDFGIAAIQDAKALTMVGMLVGSPDYMAPERIAGRPQGPPSDLWSLGATLCAALAGRSPFSRETTLATLHAVLYEEPELPAAAGPLRTVLAALLHKDPAARPTLDALEEALRSVAGPEQPPTAQPPGERPEPANGTNGPAEAPTPVLLDASRPQPPPGVREEPPRPRHPGAATATPVAPHSAPTAPRPHPAVSHPPAVTDTRTRRRTALIAAVGVLTAGALVAVAVTVLPGDGRPSAQGHDTAAAPASAPTAQDTTASAEATAPSPSAPAPTVAGTSRPPALPPGAHREAGGYAWVTPAGWRRDVRTGSEVHYTSPDGTQELAAKASLARGRLIDTWRRSERDARRGREYRTIRLEETTYRGHPAVVWEYTFTLDGAAWHARLLGFTEEGRTYQVNTWYRPGAESRALRIYEDVKAGFTVL